MAKKASAKDITAATDAFINASAVLEPIRLTAWDNIGLTVGQLRLLHHLGEKDGQGNAALADKLGLTRPSVSALLERLERGGFIRREISVADRRGIRILLEPAGKEALAGGKDDVRKELGAALSSLDEDQIKQVTEALLIVASLGDNRPA